MTAEDFYFWLCDRAGIQMYSADSKYRKDDPYWRDALALERFVRKQLKRAA